MIHFSLPSLPFFKKPSPKFFTLSFLTPLVLLLIGSGIGLAGYYYNEEFLYFVGTIIILISGVFTFDHLLSGSLVVSPRSLTEAIRSISLPNLPKKKRGLTINWLWYSVTMIMGLILLTALMGLVVLFAFQAVEQPHLATVSLVAFAAFAQTYWPFVGGALFLIVLLTQLVLLVVNRKNYSLKQAGINLVFSTANLALLILVSLHLATASVLGVRYWELQQNAALITSDPGSVGLQSQSDAIASTLKDAKEPVTITSQESDIDTHQLLVSTARVPGGSFYNDTLPQLLPQDQLPSVTLPAGPMLLSENYLLIREIVKNDFGTISPPLARLWVSSYFAPRTLKEDLPEFGLVDRQEYLRLRDVQIDDQVAEIQTEINGIGGRINSLYGQLDQIIYQYFDGVISIDEAIRRYNSVVDQIGSLERERADLQQIKQIVAGQKQITPYELGIFNPDKSIKMVLDDTDQAKLPDYLATLVHEQLHYVSYISKERRLPQFFEEGLTEHFSRRIVEKYTGVKTDLGYPIISRVIEQMAKDIPEDKLAEIYFTKNEDMLRQILDEKYGEGFYEDSEYHFLVMPLMGFDDSLQYANDIMIEIGGSEIREEEIRVE
ncbi:MAG TPA: hypothetical protein VF209_02860 [Patescibacteria group bacterium]